jgi:hypothetical protein
MKKITKLLLLPFVLLLGSCQLQTETEPTGGMYPAPVAMEYLCECLWTVADFAEGEVPCLLADPQGAVFFQEGSDTMYLFRKRDDANEDALPKDTYLLKAQCVYSIDLKSNILIVTGEGMACDFRIERLNDRTMTLCYRSDRNEYVAFSRSPLSSVTIVK